MIEAILLKIGLTRQEVKAYLCLLQLGSQPASIVAKKLNFNRSASYVTLKSLLKKGVISCYVSKKITYYTANDPNSFVAYLDSKARTFDYYKSEILSLLPSIRDLQGAMDFNQPVINYYPGIDGVKFVMFDALSARQEFLSFLPIRKWLELHLEDFLADYRNYRIQKSDVKLRAILPDTKQAVDFYQENYGLCSTMTEFVFMDDERFLNFFNNQINIYNDTVAILNLETGNEYGVLLKSRELANMLRMVFELSYASCRRFLCKKSKSVKRKRAKE